MANNKAKVAVVADTTDVTKKFQQLDKDLKGIAGSFVSFKNVALGALGAVGAFQVGSKIVSEFTSIIDKADELSKTSIKTGVSVEELSKLTYAAQYYDLTQEQLGKGITKLNSSILESRDATSEAAKNFKKLGVETIDPLTGKARKFTDVFGDLAENFSKFSKTDTQKLKIVDDIFGEKIGGGFKTFLNEGREGIQKLIKEAEEFGLVIDEEFAQNAADFKDNITRIKSAFEGLFVQGVAIAIPALQALSGAVLDVTKEVFGLNKETDKVAQQKAFINFVQNTLDSLDDLIKGFLYVKNGIGSFISFALFGFNFFKQGFGTLVSLIQNTLLAAADIFTNFGKGISNILEGILTLDKEKIKQGFLRDFKNIGVNLKGIVTNTYVDSLQLTEETKRSAQQFAKSVQDIIEIKDTPSLGDAFRKRIGDIDEFLKKKNAINTGGKPDTPGGPKDDKFKQNIDELLKLEDALKAISKTLDDNDRLTKDFQDSLENLYKPLDDQRKADLISDKKYYQDRITLAQSNSEQFKNFIVPQLEITKDFLKTQDEEISNLRKKIELTNDEAKKKALISELNKRESIQQTLNNSILNQQKNLKEFINKQDEERKDSNIELNKVLSDGQTLILGINKELQELSKNNEEAFNIQLKLNTDSLKKQIIKLGEDPEIADKLAAAQSKAFTDKLSKDRRTLLSQINQEILGINGNNEAVFKAKLDLDTEGLREQLEDLNLDQTLAEVVKKAKLDEFFEKQSDEVVRFKGELQDLTGQSSEAAKALLEIEKRDLKKAFPALGSTVDELINLKTVLVDIEKVQNDLSFTLSKQEVQEKNITDAVKAGRESELSSLYKISELRKENIGLIEEEINKQIKLLAINPTKENVQQIEELKNKLQELKDQQDPLREKFRATFGEIFKGELKELLEGTQSLGDAFEDLGKKILDSLANAVLDSAIQNLTSSFLNIIGLGQQAGSGFGGGGGGTGGGFDFGSLISSIGGAFAGGFANGGQIPANSWAMVGERGPEPIFVGKSGATVVSNQNAQQMAMGGQRNIVVNINNPRDADSIKRSRGQLSSMFAQLAASGQRNL